MRRTEEFTAASVRGALGTTVITRDGREIDMAPPWPRKPLAEAIQEACGVDVMAYRDASDGVAGLRAALVERGAAAAEGDTTWPQLVDRALSHFVEPNIVEPVFLVDYPTELSPLARPFAGDPSLVERFEAFCCGMEFANGYSELNDPELQLQRFKEQAAMQAAGDEDAQPLDADYVEALRYGMPPDRGPRPRHRPPGDARLRSPVDPRRGALPGAARQGRRDLGGLGQPGGACGWLVVMARPD